MHKILLVDDDSALLLILEHALTARGYEVNTLLEPEKVIETMDRIKPDILILDINVDGEDGYDICEEIKSIPHVSKASCDSVLHSTAFGKHPVEMRGSSHYSKAGINQLIYF